ncbi:DUF305 domain-containing protein [Deinococcus radiopugnans]|uniref:DUF305 domain-containing protein n=1 Tax=Deinococcus radiopugnans ATCC 19172 TaxID=585398 RepID=A0A5C4Y9C9_9DEIO|nr:DUF305 domain-containing protein [Deinococcus radiopugnans]MBB6015800.1 uncharacterized protein (DUF305 family) [Deinococcus radiopugnans ATCC 19172]TNM72482.1 DUF305 domain-containing protein [Deinococcus radiopugnans ATCC 19172]
MARPTAPRDPGRRLILPAVLVLLALGLAGLLLPRVTLTGGTGPAEGSTEVRFVREMIQHHAQAVDLATRIRERGRDPAVRTLALDIMLSQQEQIGQMHGWLTLWKRPWAGPGMSSEHARSMGMATPQQVARLETLPPAQAEITFLQLMTRHHQGALLMARPALGAGVRPEVQALARQIEASQGAEIRSMTALLEERGAKPLPAPQMGDMNHMR